MILDDRQAKTLEYALRTLQEALRRGCGYRWGKAGGPRPTRQELDDLAELLRIGQLVVIPHEQTGA